MRSADVIAALRSCEAVAPEWPIACSALSITLAHKQSSQRTWLLRAPSTSAWTPTPAARATSRARSPRQAAELRGASSDGASASSNTTVG